MLENISYYLIFGKPLIMYFGILTYLSLASTAYIGYMKLRGRIKISLNWHFRIAWASLILASIHGILGLASYF